MAIFSKRHLRYLKLYLLSPIVEKILLISYLFAILLFVIFNNESYGSLSTYDVRQATLSYFKYNKFLNLTVIDKSKIPTDALLKIDYDFYDYLHFLLDDRLLYVGRSPFRLIGSFRIYQFRVNLSSCDSTIPATCDVSCYLSLHSDACSELYSSNNQAISYAAPASCALSDCSEYKYVIDNNNEYYSGRFGEYSGNRAYIIDIYYGMDSKTIINKLQTNSWIDDNTRALLIRWTVYNFYLDRYVYFEANIETPNKFIISPYYYQNSVSLEISNKVLIILCLVTLTINVIVFVFKIIFELSIGLTIVTNLLEFSNCTLVFALIIAKIIEITMKNNMNNEKLNTSEYLDFSGIEDAVSVTNGLAIFSCFYIPFRFYTLMSHFKFFSPFATLLNIFYRVTPGLVSFCMILLVLVITWTLGIHYFLARYLFVFKSYFISLTSIVFSNFWDEPDYQYMQRNSPYSIIFYLIVIIVQIARYSALVFVIFMGVFLYKKATAFEKVDIPTPSQKQFLNNIEEIQETVNKLYNYKKDEIMMKEKKSKIYQNKKTVAWLLNRKKDANEVERAAFFKRLNPYLQAEQEDHEMEANNYPLFSKNFNKEKHPLIQPRYKKNRIDRSRKREADKSSSSSSSGSDSDEPQFIQPIVFEFPGQLKSFLKSLFQLKPILISSYSVDKFRIVIENYVGENESFGYYLNGLEEIIEFLKEISCKVPVLLYTSCSLHPEIIMKLRKKYSMFTVTTDLDVVMNFCRMEDISQTIE